MEFEQTLKYIAIIICIFILSYFIRKLFKLLNWTLDPISIWEYRDIPDPDKVWKDMIGDIDFIRKMKKVKLERELESAEYSTFIQTSDEKAWSSSIRVSNRIIEKIEQVDTEDINIYENLEFTNDCVWNCNLPKFETAAICFNCINYSKDKNHRNKAEIRK